MENEKEAKKRTAPTTVLIPATTTSVSEAGKVSSIQQRRVTTSEEACWSGKAVVFSPACRSAPLPHGPHP